MKKIIFLLALIFTFGSCKQKYWIDRTKPEKLSTQEMAKFKTRNDTIFYEDKAVAIYTNCEWEYYRGKKTLELSFERLGYGLDWMSDHIINYIHTRYPKAKAEVKIPKVYDIK